MRKLKTKDAPALCRCLKKLGLKNTFKTIAKESKSTQDVWDRGFELIWGLFDTATEQDGERNIYEFLAGPFEMTLEEVEDLDFDVLLANLKQLAEENDLASFFKYAAKSMK